MSGCLRFGHMRRERYRLVQARAGCVASLLLARSRPRRRSIPCDRSCYHMPSAASRGPHQSQLVGRVSLSKGCPVGVAQGLTRVVKRTCRRGLLPCPCCTCTGGHCRAHKHSPLQTFATLVPPFITPNINHVPAFVPVATDAPTNPCDKSTYGTPTSSFIHMCLLYDPQTSV